MRITGMMVYYYFVCRKKLWYFCHEINMESENEDVMLGKLIDENSYSREDKHINIDNIINIDFINTKNELHEKKKSRSIEEANIWQMKYYLYYLSERGIKDITAKIDYPLIKKTLNIELKDEDVERIEVIIADIQKINQMDVPPENENKKICKKCAYYDLCYI